MLNAQPAERVGFYEDDRRPSKITKATTDEIEQARYEIHVLDQEIKNKPIDDRACKTNDGEQFEVSALSEIAA